MKFASLFDYKYFLKGVEGNITDSELALRVKSTVGYEVKDSDYFLLTDSTESYISELKFYSRGKTFYKSLLVEELTDSNIPNLFALLTHLSIGLCDRKSVRRNVDLKHFMELRSLVDSHITDLLKSGKTQNRLLSLLKLDE